MHKLLLAGLACLGVAACATPQQATGTAVGATAGAIVGGPVGAVVGAGVGAVATAPGGPVAVQSPVVVKRRTVKRVRR